VNATWSHKDDEDIEEDIESELWWSPFVSSEEITVSVQDGVATLTGTVDSWRERRIATEKAYAGGAKSVRNHLRLRGASAAQPS
jgi:osmotically-inducible protein OsmY